jgi:hypothetical protein
MLFAKFEAVRSSGEMLPTAVTTFDPSYDGKIFCFVSTRSQFQEGTRLLSGSFFPFVKNVFV